VITCPVCEHQQPSGSECQVCGRVLEAGRGTDAPVAPLEGLESTAHAGVAVGAGTIPDLETTHHPPVAAAPVPAVPDLEPTRAEDVAAPELAPLEGLEATLAAPDEAPSPPPLTVTCRYCRTEARDGERLCARCGMRLPVLEAGRPQEPVTPAAHRCPSCGTPTTGPRCLACGGRISEG